MKTILFLAILGLMVMGSARETVAQEPAPAATPPVVVQGGAAYLTTQGISLQQTRQVNETERMEALETQINQQLPARRDRSAGVDLPLIGEFRLPEGMVIRGSMGGLAVGTEL